MTTLGVILALLLALLPLAVFLVLRSDRDRPGWMIAIDLPAAVSIDLVATYAIAHLVLLDVAVWIVKGTWVAGGAALFLYRRRKGWRPAWPGDLPRGPVLQALLVGGIGLALSLLMTRPCAIWDRQFHVPFLTSLRGQIAPFVTVYEPWKHLHYHFGGNLFAASLQASSLGILHASHALSWVHDFSSFWFGVTITLVLRRLGLRYTTLLALVFLAMLFASPVVPLEGEHRTWFAGYSMTNYMSLSFRPHVTLAALVTLPFIAVPMLRLKELDRPLPLSALGLPLVACVPLMLIVDEFSLGILGLGLGAVWLRFPQVFAPTRRQGVYLFAALGLAMGLGIAVMHGTVALGAPRYPIRLVFPRSPGFYTASVPFSNPQGIRYFFSDLLPILGVLVGGALLLVRSRDVLLRGTFIMFSVVVIVSVFLFATLEYSGSGLQNHRFVTVPMLFGPLFAAAWLIPRPGANLRFSGLAELGIILVVGLGAASGLDWLGGIANSDCRAGDIDLAFYNTNCRADTGAGVVTTRTRPMYFDPAIQYLTIGCRPAFMAGPASSMDGHDLKVGKAKLGIDALKELNDDARFQLAAGDLTVACGRGPTGDPACALLKEAGACQPAGEKIEICTMSSAQRATALKRAGK
ncbi:MAG: hypothetical protein ABUR63_02910 [Verrucomicrobiota bacterium]